MSRKRPLRGKGEECEEWRIKDLHIADPSGIDIAVDVINAIFPEWFEWERLRDVARAQGDRVKAVLEGIEEVDPF